jgi:small subunit ribosomal protein S9
MSAASSTIVTVGRRKTAVARVRLAPGTGKITINKREFEDYLKTESLQRIATLPLSTANAKDQYDFTIIANGGGITGQAGAISLGIARALQKLNPELRSPLKKAGHLKRDPRAKERKKPGRSGARKRYQFTKR